MPEIETLPRLAPIRIETRRLTVEPFGEERITERYVSWLNDAEVVAQSVQRYRNHAIETCRAYLASFQASDDQFLAIVCKSDELGHIGNMTIRVDARNGLADLSILIGEKRAWRKGYATEAVLRLLEYVFDDLNKHRVIATTDCLNDRSIALLERVGMRREGHYLQNHWFKGAWGDEYQYAMLRSEWNARAAR